MFARPKTYIINITQNQKLDDQDVGNIGMDYAKLASTGVLVPETFVISTPAFDDFITAANLVDPISDVLDSLDSSNEHEARLASAEISKLILNANIPSILLTPLVQAYKELSGYTDKYVSIKPSWIFTSELIPSDRSEYEFTNIRGEGALLYHVKQAWTSLFSPDALRRRVEFGYSGGLSIAIVVQRLIQPEISGITYSASPIEMDKSIIEIEAMLGLMPEEIPKDMHADLYKVEKESLQIHEKHILEQDYMLLRKGRAKEDEEPIIKVDISSDWRRKQKLNDTAISDIAEVAKYLEAKYDHPVEIRWVYETGNIFITSLSRLSPIADAKPSLSRLLEEAEKAPGVEIKHDSESERRKRQLDINELAEEVSEMIDEVVEDEPSIVEEFIPVPPTPQDDLDLKVAEILAAQQDDEEAAKEDLQTEEQEPETTSPSPEPQKRGRGRPTKAEQEAKRLEEEKLAAEAEQRKAEEAAAAEIKVEKTQEQLEPLDEKSAMQEALSELPEATEMPPDPIPEPPTPSVEAIAAKQEEQEPETEESKEQQAQPASEPEEQPEQPVEPEEIEQPVIPEGGSVLDALPPELRKKIEEAAAQAPEEVVEEVQPDPEPEEEKEQQKSIVDEVQVEQLEAKPILVKDPIKQTYNMNTDVYLDISALDTGTLANASNFDGAFLDGTAVIMRHKILPESLSDNKDDLRKLIEAYALEISTAAKAIGNKPVFYSFSDIGDELRNQLLGKVANEGGLDGSERFVLKPEALITEVLAVKKAKTVYGATNLRVVMPRLRSGLEVVEMKKIMNSQNFTRTSTLQLFAEVATPSFLYELEHTEGSELDGVIVNFPKLAQGMTGRSEFVPRDHKAILSAIKLMLDFNRNKPFDFIIKMNDNPELVQAIFEAKITSAAFVFNDIPTEETFKIIKNFELEPLKKETKRGRKPKELKSDV